MLFPDTWSLTPAGVKTQIGTLWMQDLLRCVTRPLCKQKHQLSQYHNCLYISVLYPKVSYKHPFLNTKHPLSSLGHQDHIPLVSCFWQISWTAHSGREAKHARPQGREMGGLVQAGDSLSAGRSAFVTLKFARVKGRKEEGGRKTRTGDTSSWPPVPMCF